MKVTPNQHGRRYATRPFLHGSLTMEHFDVFLCHNSADKPAVRQINTELIGREIRPWFDESELQPGISWKRELVKCLPNIKSAAVFVGGSGIGPWQDEEIDNLLQDFKDRDCPIIPVLLADAPDKPQVPLFLRARTWVDFRATETDPMTRLVWGIRGRKPNTPTSTGVQLRIKYEGAYALWDIDVEVLLDGKKVGSGSLKKGFDCSANTATGDHVIIIKLIGIQAKIFDRWAPRPFFVSFPSAGTYEANITLHRYSFFENYRIAIKQIS